MEKLFVSIVIPCYNHGIYLPEALESIQRSIPTHLSYEIIVVNDGSTDSETIHILDTLTENFTNTRVIHQNNQGLGAARNAGIRSAIGNYIIPLDADNTLTQEMFIQLEEKLEKSSRIAVLFGNAAFFGEETGVWEQPEYVLSNNLFRNSLDACAAYPKVIWEQVGGYDENMPYMGYEDWDFWIRVKKQGFGFYRVSKVVFNYRVVNDSMIRTSSEQKMIETRRYILLKHPDLIVDDVLKYYTLKDIFKRKFFFGFIKITGHFLKNR